MVEPGDYIGANGIAIRWRRLFVEIVGATILAYVTGVVDIILSLADIPIGLLSFVAEWYATLVELVTGSLARILLSSARGAALWVRTTGLAGFLLAIIIVLATTYSVAEVVSRVR
jgi:hypothetical protein